MVNVIDDLNEIEVHKLTNDELISYDVDNLTVSISNSVLCILDNSVIFQGLEGLTGKEFELKLLSIINSLREKGYNFDKIDLSGILSKDTKRELSSIISLNYPILEISRLLPGEKVVNIQFVGVKDLNDKISKEFTDLFIGKVKDKLINNFDLSVNKLNINGRLIRSNYKHITFSFDAGFDINRLVYYEYNFMSFLIHEVFSSIGDRELGKISNGLSRDEIEKILFNYFLLSTGSGIVKQSVDNSKMIAFYDAEMSSRDEKYKKFDCFEEKKHDLKKIKSYSNKLMRIENLIFKKYVFGSFTLDNTDYKIVVKDNNGNKKINDILIRAVRKGKSVVPKRLELLLMQYLTFLNDGFDFIGPSLNGKLDRDEIDHINNSISTGIINIQYIEKNYKGTYTRNALEAISKGKDGINVFIDIIDMGLMNATDFMSIADKISSLRNKKVIYEELLKAGNSVTEKFVNYVFSILDKYDDIKIALGGDEIFIFIEGKNIKKSKIDYLSSTLKDNGLRGRISFTTTNNSNKLDEINQKDNSIFDTLDNYTSINKIFETRLEKVISKIGLTNTIDIPNNTFLLLTEKNKNYINSNFNSFLNKLSANINELSIESFLKFGMKKKVKVAEFDNINVSLEVYGDSLNIIV